MYRIYYVLDIEKNKYYIGQTSRTIEARFKNHKNDNRPTKLLSMRMREADISNFKIVLLEETPNKENADSLETDYINKYNSVTPFGYNIRSVGGSHAPQEEASKEKLRSKLVSPETRAKISIAQQGEKHHSSKLTDSSVLEIRRLLEEEVRLTDREIGDLFGVSGSLIYTIKTGRGWKHLNTDLPVINRIITDICDFCKKEFQYTIKSSLRKYCSPNCCKRSFAIRSREKKNA